MHDTLVVEKHKSMHNTIVVLPSLSACLASFLARLPCLHEGPSCLPFVPCFLPCLLALLPCLPAYLAAFLARTDDGQPVQMTCSPNLLGQEDVDLDVACLRAMLPYLPACLASFLASFLASLLACLPCFCTCLPCLLLAYLPVGLGVALSA